MSTGFLVGLTLGLVVVNVAFAARSVMLRRRHGGVPLPGWLLTTRNASPELRSLVARLARAELRDVLQEWTDMPVGLREGIRREIRSEIMAILRRRQQ